MVMASAPGSSGVLFWFAQGEDGHAAPIRIQTRTLHRGQQQFQADSGPSDFSGRIRALESIHESHTTRHSAGAIEQPQSDRCYGRMEKAVRRKLLT